jgi:hypothetical protein
MMKTSLVIASSVAILMSCATSQSERDTQLTAKNPVYQEECAGCHDLYPPGLLAAHNWHDMMNHLDHHFGMDASVPEHKRTTILAFLVQNSASAINGRHTSDSLRITMTPYFLSVHGGSSIPLWDGKLERKASNCSSCHKSANDELW